MNGYEDGPVGRLEVAGRLRDVARERRAKMAFAAEERRRARSDGRKLMFALGSIIGLVLFGTGVVTDGYQHWGGSAPAKFDITITGDGLSITRPDESQGEWFTPRWHPMYDLPLNAHSPPRSLIGKRWYYDRDLMGRRI